jgi:hypothetical protein
VIKIFVDSEGNVSASGLTPGQIIRLQIKTDIWTITRYGTLVLVKKQEEK